MLRRLPVLAFLLLPALGPAPARAAAGAAAPIVAASDAWARATVEGQSGSGVYLRLSSREDAVLVGASSPATDKVEIHEMRQVQDMMHMRRIERLALPAGKTVSLEHDFHIMLIGLRHQLKPGQTLALTLQLLDAHGGHQTLALEVPVRPIDTPVPVRHD